MSSKKSSKRAPPARELDLSNATRGVWLLKVPNYLANVWQLASNNSELGVMRIKSQPRKVEVSFTLTEELAKQAMVKGMEIPREHRMMMRDTSRQSLATFSEEGSSGQVLAEGKVTQKADIQPVESASYMKLKQQQIKAAEKTKFQAQQLDRTPATVRKPITQTKEYGEHEKKKKEQGKRARGDREEVLDLLFTAFQQHQYYNFRDLVHKTKQPPAYLKEILREVCVYNTKAPHKNMWELKPEYRHYKESSSSV